MFYFDVYYYCFIFLYIGIVKIIVDLWVFVVKVFNYVWVGYGYVGKVRFGNVNFCILYY